MATVDIVLKKIAELFLEEGGRLPSERTLAASCGVSRTSIRNALKELQSRRVLDVRQGSGYFLASQFALEQAVAGADSAWTAERIRQVLEARCYLEPHVLAIGAQNMASEDLGSLEACLVSLGEATVGNDAAAAVWLHRAFFQIIQRRCRNREFIRMLNEVRIPQGFAVDILTAASFEEKNALFSEHVNLFQLIKKKEFSAVGEGCRRIHHLVAELFRQYAEVLAF